MTWYITRESVKGALDSKETARNNAQIDRCIATATDQITGLVRRRFDPLTATLYFEPPRGDVLWFGLRSLSGTPSAVTVDGTALDVADLLVTPYDGPPYDGIRASTSSGASLSGALGAASIAITGSVDAPWGYDLNEPSVGTIAEALDASETGVDLDGPASAEIGVGSVIRVDDERMTVTARAMLTTTVTLSANLTASKADTAVTVSSGAGVTAGETVMIDAEKMTVHEIAGNVLSVTRGVDGTALSAHLSGVTVYAPRTVTVTRGALGTVAASHSTAAAVSVWQPPALVSELALAYALTSLGQGQSGYARMTGSGDNEREASGRGLRQIQADAKREYKRWLHGSAGGSTC